ncbi:hypothetical protein Ddye_006729 [Dipteronia dyeriana]|uniref:HAT C-terminal dimerisation domain-containing protein n=1 Tax=Dipteronia dyeriana TaxID=168575 RepID=A0AAD9XIJ1_9ROSI|nr:hypothetical protein Ddye_006729 [Dipteronia dyeriana]
MGVRMRGKKSPAEWWDSYGTSTPALQKFAIKILSLTCSSSRCKRNWSVFESLHTKRRNRLDQSRLNDLVFVKYNRALKRQYDARDTIDPIYLNEIDESNEWLTGRLDDEKDGDDELVFTEEDNLTWNAVATVAGVREPSYQFREREASSSRVPQVRPMNQLLDKDESEEEIEGQDEGE